MFPNSSVNYNNGIWQNLGTTTPVSLNAWKFIKVVANASTNTAAVYVNGALLGNATKQTASATSINGFLFGSGGSTVTGDEALFDDVNLYDTPAQPLNLMSSVSTSNTLALSENDKQELNIENTSGLSVSVSPNPAHTTVRVDVDHHASGNLTLRILDLNGKEVKRADYTLSGNKSSLELPVQELSPGIYVIQVVQNGNKSTSKLIVN